MKPELTDRIAAEMVPEPVDRDVLLGGIERLRGRRRRRRLLVAVAVVGVGLGTVWRGLPGPSALVEPPVLAERQRAGPAGAFAHVGTIPGQGGELVGEDGFSLTLPDQGVDGEITVRWRVVNTLASLDEVPGELATRVDGAVTPLESFGMAHVELSVDGWVHALDGVAHLEVPLVEGHPFDQGDSIGLYHLADSADLWTHEGHGRVDGDRFVASVSHFSWWNADRPVSQTGCICGSVSNGSEGLVTATGRDVLVRSRARVHEGRFCLDSLAGAPVVLQARSVVDGVCKEAVHGAEVSEPFDACTEVALEYVPCGAPAPSQKHPGRGRTRPEPQVVKPRVVGSSSVKRPTLESADLQVLHRKVPRYPAGETAPTQRCSCSVVVGADGVPLEVQTGCKGAFDRAAREALLEWRWAPIVVDGQPTDAETMVSVVFRLPVPAPAPVRVPVPVETVPVPVVFVGWVGEPARLRKGGRVHPLPSRVALGAYAVEIRRDGVWVAEVGDVKVTRDGMLTCSADGGCRLDPL